MLYSAPLHQRWTLRILHIRCTLVLLFFETVEPVSFVEARRTLWRGAKRVIFRWCFWGFSMGVLLSASVCFPEGLWRLDPIRWKSFSSSMMRKLGLEHVFLSDFCHFFPHSRTVFDSPASYLENCLFCFETPDVTGDRLKYQNRDNSKPAATWACTNKTQAIKRLSEGVIFWLGPNYQSFFFFLNPW